MFEVNDKVYFGRGPMEFVGVVLAVSPDKAAVSGVELGCLSPERETVEIGHLDSIRVLDAAEWEQRIANEVAFADLTDAA